jgi:hypothetical protein
MKGIFFHIPKTAGTSQIAIVNKYDFLQCYNRQGYHDIKSVKRININNIFTWTIVRNPLDRLASILGAWRWKNIHKEMNNILDLVELGHKLDWKLSDMFNVVSQDIQKTDLWQRTDMAIMLHLVPLHVCVDRWQKDINRSLDFIGKFETIQQDWEFIKDKICIDDDLPLLNKSEHYPYQKYFKRKALLDRAIEFYEEDFNRFNYYKGIK